MKQITLELAEVLEHRHRLKDFTPLGLVDYEQIGIREDGFYDITDICRIITRLYKQNGISYWTAVTHNLPSKYKNQDEIEQGRINALANLPTKVGNFETNQQELQQNPAKFLIENSKQLVKDLSSVIEHAEPEQIQESFKALEKAKDLLLEKARQDHIAIYSEKSYHDAKELIDEKVSVIKHERVSTTFSEAFGRLAKRILELQIEAEYFPPKIKEKELELAGAIDSLTDFLTPYTDDKYSLDSIDWMEVDEYYQRQSKHGAAEFKTVMSNLCAVCSAGVFDDPNDFVEMNYDSLSPTGWRCPNKFDHVKGIPRALTREQVGDKHPDVVKFSRHLVGAIPAFMALGQWYREWKAPPIAARKIRKHLPFSEKAFSNSQLM